MHLTLHPVNYYNYPLMLNETPFINVVVLMYVNVLVYTEVCKCASHNASLSTTAANPFGGNCLTFQNRGN